jgi:putative heme degradation protein
MRKDRFPLAAVLPADDAAPDVTRLRAAWKEAETPDAFRSLLVEFGVSELEAFCLLGSETAFPITMATVRALLALSVDLGVPVAVLVEDCRVDAREFQRRLRSELFGSAWIVRRPGMLRAACLELFDAHGKRVVRFEAGEGEHARAAWAVLLGAHSEGST